MKLTCKILLSIAVVIVAITIYKIRELIKPLPLQKFDEDVYWGPGPKSNYKEDKTIKPFKITFPDNEVQKLKAKLTDYNHIHPQLEGVNYEYGMNTNVLKRILKYWHDDYLSKWNTTLNFFNGLPQFKTQIQGLNIHFIHSKPKGDLTGKTVFPLLLIHGWPGSVREFYEIIPKLNEIRDDQDFVFEVIAPSLPGYGWSDAARKTGLSATQTAIVLRNLMKRLGFEKYYVQGGDWGSVIGSHITTIYPQEVIGYHSNMCVVRTPLTIFKDIICNYYPSWAADKEHQSLYFPLADKFKFLLQESGYFHLQATKPDTIGAAIEHNPIALAAYIIEKFITFSQTLGYDALLDNLMVYYITNSFTTAARLYAETSSEKEIGYQMFRVRTQVPTACIRFTLDIIHAYDWQLKDKYPNLIQSTYSAKGGHFAAFEVPDILYKDFIEFVKKTLKFHKL